MLPTRTLSLLVRSPEPNAYVQMSAQSPYDFVPRHMNSSCLLSLRSCTSCSQQLSNLFQEAGDARSELRKRHHENTPNVLRAHLGVKAAEKHTVHSGQGVQCCIDA